jgi:hypothetical protein
MFPALKKWTADLYGTFFSKDPFVKKYARACTLNPLKTMF